MSHFQLNRLHGTLPFVGAWIGASSLLAGLMGLPSFAVAQTTADPKPVTQPATNQAARPTLTADPAPTPSIPMADADDQGDDDDNGASDRWPMRFDIPQGQLTVYQPQLTGFEQDKMTGRAAVSLLAPNATEPAFGAIWLESRVTTDRVARTVQINDVTVKRVRFPQSDNISQDTLSTALTEAFKREPMVMSLDQLVAMVDAVKKDAQAVKELVDAPPKIVFVNQPAVLVQFDGEPRLVQSKTAQLKQVVNTPFFVVYEAQIKRYYLKGAGRWYIAREASGPYLAIDSVPAYVSDLASTDGYVDPEEDMAQVKDQLATPAIITTNQPTELIWTNGVEELSPIENTNLLYVTNTDSDIILDIDSQLIYVLLSGRWYRATTRTGPWTYISPDQLPADFARIPANSDKGSVLAHVAGTQMAKDALADNWVPQTASIDRATYEQPVITYDGDPQFQQVDKMRITYAINTPNAVLRIGGRYYTCYNAVWYESDIATGPWALCTSVPQEVYLLPPSCPVYPVRYVRIYEVTPTIVYTGYLPGYVGSYVHHGVVVYGTGYYYHPWYGRAYYPRPCTWGFAPRYDPYRSYWGFSVGVSLNFGNGLSLWFGSANRYTPAYSAWFGYGGYRPIYHHHHYRPHAPYNRQAYRADYRNVRDLNARRPSPRRDDLNLYERRRDVIHTANRSPNNRNDDRTAGNNNPRGNRDVNRDAGRDVNRDRNPRGEQPDRTEQARRNDRLDRIQGVDRTPADRNDRGNTQANRSDNPTRPEARANRSDETRGRNGQAQTRNPNAVQPGGRNANLDRNNLFADEEGNVYRKTLDGWERRDTDQWVPRTSDGRLTPAARDNTRDQTPSATRGNRGNATPATPRENPRANQTVTPDDRRNLRDQLRTQNPAAVEPGSRPAAAQRTPSTPAPSRTVTPRQSIDSNDNSLNNDFRARVMGQQREQIYQQRRQDAAPANRFREAPAPVIRGSAGDSSPSPAPSRSQASPSRSEGSQSTPSAGRGDSGGSRSSGENNRGGSSGGSSGGSRGGGGSRGR